MNEVARIFGARQVAVEAENARAWQDATTNRRRDEILRGEMEMKVRRKFNLNRIGKSYEMLDIEVEHDTIELAAQEIEEAWRTYCKMIAERKIQ